MALHVQSPPMEFLVEFVNTWAEAVHHDPAPTQGRTYPSLAAFLDRHGTPSVPAVSNADLVSAADEAYLIFAAPPEHRLAAANRVLRMAKLEPILSEEAGSWWIADEDLAISALVGSSLLRYAQVDQTLSRLGTCTATGCRDAYIDASQARTRRFCGERCQTRAKAQRRRS